MTMVILPVILVPLRLQARLMPMGFGSANPVALWPVRIGGQDEAPCGLQKWVVAHRAVCSKKPSVE